MKIKNLENSCEYEIYTTKQGGEDKMTCPTCSKDRKKKTDKCFSWNHDKKVGKCAHCQSSFVLVNNDFKYVSREKREYKRPEWKNQTTLSDKALKYFEGRGISQFTLRQMQISEGAEWMPQNNAETNTIQFNYFRSSELVNTKFRTGDKKFKLVSGAELIFYNYDNCIGKEQIIIVEGEFDALSCFEIGLTNVISVPNGAGLGEINLTYLDNCIELFDNATQIILATDNDTAGTNLKNQLAHRLGIERCFKVDFSPYKDANDVLIHEGRESLKNRLVNGLESFPIDGVFTVKDFSDDLDLLYSEGLKQGALIDIPEFNELISFEKGRLYTWTGIPGHGKSEIVDHVMERLNIMHNWKIAYFSPENHPLSLHSSKIIEKITGQRFSSKTLSKSHYESAKEYLKDNFYFINPQDDYKVETILEKAKQCVLRYGISALVIDPYNKLDHQFNGSETQYISSFLDKIINFAKKNNVSVHLIAHPRKMQKDAAKKYEVPTLYDINGSANFYNKTDFGISVYRDFNTSFTTVYVQKVKFKHLGKVGLVNFMWNKDNGRYTYFDGKDVNRVSFDNSNHLEINMPTEVVFDNDNWNIDRDLKF